MKKIIFLVTYEILGNVVNTIRFQSLADFQFVLPKDKTDELPMDVKLDDAINMFGQKFDMPPPFFTRFDKPLPYKYVLHIFILNFVRFKQNPLSTEVQVADELGKIVTKRKLKKSYYDKHAEMASIEFAATSVPMHVLSSSVEPPNEKFLDALRAKFEDRPIWSKRALLAQFDGASKTLMRNSLPHVSYTFSNGPWRLLYTRLGFDPRTRQNRHTSVKYQIIDFRFPRKYDDMFKRKSMKGLEQRHMPHRVFETNPNEDEYDFFFCLHFENRDKTYIFDSLPKQKQSTYQLCDVPQIQSILESTTLTRTCDIKKGWLTKQSMKEIRDEMKSKLEEWIKDAPEHNQQAQQNDSDASKSSEDEDADFPLDQAAQIFDL